MKKKVSIFALILIMIVCAFSFVACGDKVPPDNKLNIEQVYTLAKDAGYTGTLEELIAAFKGDSAYKIAVANGYTGSEADWLASLVGAGGTDGVNGITPHIGENGNWFIGASDTGVKAHGDKGDKGDSGTNGLSAYEIFKKYNPEYKGVEEQWIKDFINGHLTRFTITFKVAGSEDIVKSVLYGYDLIDIPLVPEKVGNIGEWDRTTFTNITENIIVTAIYKTKGLTYELINNNAEYKLISANIEKNVTTLEIPSVYNGKPVTAIGKDTFSSFTSLVSITIPFVGEKLNGTVNTNFSYIFGAVPSTLKTVIITGGNSISEKAFSNCAGLTTIKIPDSVTTIGGSAFEGCSNLQYEIVDGNLNYLSNVLIGVKNTSLKSATLKPTTTIIYVNALSGCARLTSVTIPNSVTTIGSFALYGCTGLTTITIPDSVTTIGGGAFYDCTNLNSITVNEANISYSSKDGILYNKAQTQILFVPKAISGSVTISNGMTSIVDSAFRGCARLISITIPGSVTSIGYDAFSGCTGLTTISMPNSLETIGSSAFGGCAGLKSVTIPDSVTTIGREAFQRCTGLTTITIGSGVTTINLGAFSDCTALKTINIPNSVTTIGSCAFYGCTALTAITLGNGVTTIGEQVFNTCSALTTVYYAGADITAWDKIVIQKDNPYLIDAARYYYSETQPTATGNFWHYVNNEPTIWVI